MRGYSSVHTQQPAGPVREIEMDPYLLLDDDIKYVTQDIREVSIQNFIQSILVKGKFLKNMKTGFKVFKCPKNVFFFARNVEFF